MSLISSDFAGARKAQVSDGGRPDPATIEARYLGALRTVATDLSIATRTPSGWVFTDRFNNPKAYLALGLQRHRGLLEIPG